MAESAPSSPMSDAVSLESRYGVHVRRNLLIAIVAFLTLVDLFAMQAILPSLAASYAIMPSEMGVAVNASTIGMAIAGLAISVLGSKIDQRRGIMMALGLLAAPTLLLSFMPNIAIFTALRIAQGLCMASAFTLTLAYLGAVSKPNEAAGAFAAYITGNVASNLFGRLLAAATADHLGLEITFLVFAGLNLCGVLVAAIALPRQNGSSAPYRRRQQWGRLLIGYLRAPDMRAGFAIGFLILFAFIGVFSYVNFVLVAPPISIAPMSLGFAYFVFLPSIVTTPMAGPAIQRIGVKGAVWLGFGCAALAMPLLVSGRLDAILVGLALFGIGTFLAQAAATGYISRAAAGDGGAASGLYLACYFTGGLVGAALLGSAFDRFGWGSCVAGAAVAIGLGSILARQLGGNAPDAPMPR